MQLLMGYSEMQHLIHVICAKADDVLMMMMMRMPAAKMTMMLTIKLKCSKLTHTPKCMV